MTPTTELPSTAVAFQRFMEYIWEFAPLHEYDQYENALRTIRRCGARRTGGSTLAGESAHVYRFPGESDYISIKINYRGSALAIKYRAFGRRTK
jgi:hypothetical protein